MESQGFGLSEETTKKDDKNSEITKGVEVSVNNISPKLKYMLIFYYYLQLFMFTCSIAYILYMRIDASKYIDRIENVWNWEEHCKELYYFFSGVSYGVATLGFVNFFLVNDALKKLGKKKSSVRVTLKTIFELVIASVQLGIIISVYIYKSLDTCGTKVDRQEAQKIYYASFVLFSLYLLSQICYSYLRTLLRFNENCRIIYTYFLKDKYL